MRISAKKLRILFVDDEELETPKALKTEGYDVEHWRDVENLDHLCDGRYQIILLDVRGIGEKYGGNGLDILKYIATHNPLIYVCVFSAKPFTGEEAEIIRKFAKKAITKDCTIYDLIEIFESYASTLSERSMMDMIENQFKLNFIDKWKLRHGYQLSQNRLEKISNASQIGVDAIKIARNMISGSIILYKLFHGIV